MSCSAAGAGRPGTAHAPPTAQEALALASSLAPPPARALSPASSLPTALPESQALVPTLPPRGQSPAESAFCPAKPGMASSGWLAGWSLRHETSDSWSPAGAGEGEEAC